MNQTEAKDYLLLASVPWPKCIEGCRTIDYFGASECEDICPHKFKEPVK